MGYKARIRSTTAPKPRKNQYEKRFPSASTGLLTSLEVSVLLINHTTIAVPRDLIIPYLHRGRALCPQDRDDCYVDEYSEYGTSIEDPNTTVLAICSLELEDEDDDSEFAKCN
jgi:hypothetical protein